MAVAHGLQSGLNSCDAWALLLVVHGIFPDQGLNLCLMHWQADSFPLRHQGSHLPPFFKFCNDDWRNLCVGHTCFQAFSGQALCWGWSEDGHNGRGPVLMKPLPQDKRISRHPRALSGGKGRGQWPPLEELNLDFQEEEAAKLEESKRRRGCDPGEGTGWVRPMVWSSWEGTAGDTVLLELRVRPGRGGKCY